MERVILASLGKTLIDWHRTFIWNVTYHCIYVTPKAQDLTELTFGPFLWTNSSGMFLAYLSSNEAYPKDDNWPDAVGDEALWTIHSDDMYV